MVESDYPHMKLRWKYHLNSLASKCHYLLEQEKFLDVNLMASNGQIVKAHRLILCASSQYFEDYFSQQSETSHVVTFKVDAQEEVLRALIQFIYKGEMAVLRDQLYDLLKTASALKLHGLIDHAEELYDRFSPQPTGMMQQLNSSSSLSSQKMSAPNIGSAIEEGQNIMMEKEECNTPRVGTDEDERMDGKGSQISSLMDVSSITDSSYDKDSANLFTNAGSSEGIRIISVQSLATNNQNSPERKTNRLSSKRKESHQHHSSSNTNFSNHPTLSKHKPSLKDGEGTRKISLNSITLKQQEYFQVSPSDLTILEEGTLPASILSKRDSYVAEVEKENDFKEGHSYSQENASTVSSITDMDFDIPTCYSSVETNKKGAKSVRKTNSSTEKTQKVLPSPPKKIPKGTYQCDVCGRSYKYKKDLNTHLKNVCGKDPSFPCTLCKYRTWRKCALKKHLVRVHNMNDSQLAAHAGLGPKIRPVFPFKCDKCPRTYKRKENLNRHMQHECDGVDPRFQCILCEYRFKQKENLRNHLTHVHEIGFADFVAHGVGYAFQCHLCPFSFGQNGALQKHVTTEHAGK